MDPPIEDISAKWACLTICQIILRAEEQFERCQIKYQLELLCTQNGVNFADLDFTSWSIGKDFLGSSDLRFRRCAPYLSVQRENSLADLLFHCFMTVADLPNMLGNYQIAERLRSRRLIELTTIIVNFPVGGICICYL